VLENVRVQNYKCLLNTEVELGAFNVLIGPNDSGKTSFFEAVHLLAATQFGDMSSLVWEKRRERAIVLEATGRLANSKLYKNRIALTPENGDVTESLKVDQGTLFDTASISRNSDRSFMLGTPSGQIHISRNARPLAHMAPRIRTGTPSDQFADILLALQSSMEFQLDPKAMRAAVQASPTPSLNQTGSNLAAVLQAMLSGPDRKTVIELESKLHDAIPTLSGISLSTLANSTHQIEFTLTSDARPPVTIPCSQASDGAMLLLGFLVLVYGNTPSRLLIEEPENGLHPSRLEMVVDILRKISTGEIGNRPRQVILTSHSPLLLNYVQPEDVRVFRRDEKLGTKVDSMDKLPNIAKLRKEFAPGELWYLFGEEDLVKGKAS
jgi:predicted ATPase